MHLEFAFMCISCNACNIFFSMPIVKSNIVFLFLALQEISFNAAQQLRRHPEEDPPFLSPSKPLRPLMAGPQRTIYASETPERENAAIFSNIQPPTMVETPKSSVLRDAPVKNHAIRDKITVNRESSEI